MKVCTQTLENRACAYCGTEFSVRHNLPYYSCSACRNKEKYDRMLVYKPCEKCGSYFSTSPWARFCRSCAAKNKHELGSANSICKKCGKPILSTGDEYCIICKKNSIVLQYSRKCLYCGDQLPGIRGAKVCTKCSELITSDGKAGKCLECGARFTIKSGTSTKFCCKSCETAWYSKHGCKARTADYVGNSETDTLIYKAEEYLRANPNASRKDILTALHISASTAMRKGIRVTDIKNKLGITTKKSSSLFENDICSILNEMGIKYVREKYFHDLKDERYLRYDFYIEDLNLLIEADGAQHYGKDFTKYYRCDAKGAKRKGKIKQHDVQKNEYAKNHGYNLLRVKYFRFYEKKKVTLFKSLIEKIQCVYRETGKLELFNCWNGSELIPISSQAPQGEGSETIP